ncbi:hypothetical protein [Streptomyces sp. NPDC003660]
MGFGPQGRFGDQRLSCGADALANGPAAAGAKVSDRYSRARSAALGVRDPEVDCGARCAPGTLDGLDSSSTAHVEWSRSARDWRGTGDLADRSQGDQVFHVAVDLVPFTDNRG